ncbi:MAG: Xanthine dehydrogenase molybdenum-binding subunit [Firmicutes bacterium ADurb.Bin182]|nr:MAG: Xanthine dehydrogenase molybdenum-binding subunit [Firmicutes bacterium ADurb.Bin182]
MENTIGKSFERKEACDKVTGKAKYAGDIIEPGALHAKLVTSSVAHGAIKSVDISEALSSPNVLAVITGKDFPILSGAVLEDRPPIAIDKVRYFGEPVALVVALSEKDAAIAAGCVKVEYEPLPVLNSVKAALAPGAPLIHSSLCSYKALVKDVYPEANTNIVSRYVISKGNVSKGFGECRFIVERDFSLPKSSHAAMETRTSSAEILSDGSVNITTASQSPFFVRKLLSGMFSIDEGKIKVTVPLVGGSFGGKAAVQAEILAFMASKAAGGRKVVLSFSREQDFATTPGRLGLDAKIKLGCDQSGVIKAAQMQFFLDTGAYADIGPYMSKAIAANCSGPYNIENLFCESVCVYTNHGYSNSFRGFSHESFTFCLERSIDMLASKCNLSQPEIRLRNAIKPGDRSPTQVEISHSNAGNPHLCLEKIKALINWDEGALVDIGGGKVRAKGISCLWKSSTSPTDASAGALITFNSDGSLNLTVGVVEIGSGGQSILAHMLAEKMKMDYARIFVKTEVDTQRCPYYWKTVASMTSYMAGNAVIRAADDAIAQLKSNASLLLRCPSEELDIENEFVYVKHEPGLKVAFKDLVYGIKYPNGNAAGAQILGRGSFVMPRLTPMNRLTGEGKTGPGWTVGAQAVEVEFDGSDCSYKILKAATVMDVGKVIDTNAAECMIRGGMSMGLSLASREDYIYDENCIMQMTSLRNYKVLHIGEEPRYLVDFVETPQLDSPFGTRAFSEHGIIGMPSALANALSLAAGAEINELPLTPEVIWRSVRKGGRYDPVSF